MLVSACSNPKSVAGRASPDPPSLCNEKQSRRLSTASRERREK